MFFNIVSLILCGVLLFTTIDVVHSRFSYVSKIHRRIEPNKIVGSWEQAKKHCEEEGSVLASPLTTELLDLMLSYIRVNNHSVPYFIGTKATNDIYPQFVTVEGEPLDSMPDAVIDMIEKLDPRDGECLAMDRTSIKAVPCWLRLPYICYSESIEGSVKTNEKTEAQEKVSKPMSTLTLPRTTAATETKNVDVCGEPGYNFSIETGSCYKLHTNYANWTVANVTCNTEEGYLIILNDENEVKHILKMLESSYVWVGFQIDAETDQWRSVKGDAVENLYTIGLGENIGSISRDSRCSALPFDKTLLEINCDDEIAFICERTVSL